MKAWLVRLLWSLPILIMMNTVTAANAFPHQGRLHTPAREFSELSVKGDINLHIHTGYAASSVALNGDARDLDQVQLKINRKGVLCITLNPDKPRHGPIFADVRTRYLNGLCYEGKGVIQGDHLRANLERVILDNQGPTTLSGVIRLTQLTVSGPGYVQLNGVTSPHLHVTLSEAAKVKLTGKASIRRLDLADNSWFSLSWVESPTLIVKATGKSYVQLAGIVNKLDAELFGFSELNARYLRANRAFVKTHDNSVANISTTKHQHTLAADASDIRFYNLPDMKTDFMSFDGAVLDMRAFNTEIVKDVTPFNR